MVKIGTQFNNFNTKTYYKDQSFWRKIDTRSFQIPAAQNTVEPMHQPQDHQLRILDMQYQILGIYFLLCKPDTCKDKLCVYIRAEM